MLRNIYICLLRLHPACFRYRFGDEMLADFDSAAKTKDAASLILDGAVSVFRQWIRRPHGKSVQATVSDGAVRPLLFQTMEDHKLSAGAIVNGSLLSTVLLCAAIFAIGHGGAKSPLLMVGALYSRPGLLPFDRASLAESELDTQIRLPAERQDPWRSIAVLYFKLVRILGALDRDRDYTISSSELAAAAKAILILDGDRNGKLSPEECGFVLGPTARARLMPDFVERVRLQFMRANPVIAPLDSDVDGELSAEEIRTARSALGKLDRNGDRMLTPNEVIPDLVSKQVSMILFRLDENGDDKLSMREALDSEADPLRRIIETADRNRDGVTTRQELTDRLQLSHEVKSRLDRSLRAIP